MLFFNKQTRYCSIYPWIFTFLLLLLFLVLWANSKLTVCSFSKFYIAYQCCQSRKQRWSCSNVFKLRDQSVHFHIPLHISLINHISIPSAANESVVWGKRVYKTPAPLWMNLMTWFSSRRSVGASLMPAALSYRSLSTHCFWHPFLRSALIICLPLRLALGLLKRQQRGRTADGRDTW